ncbi:hypothetical protein EON65_09170 [archaeon]|nr:MAG: hypothetical protein EON65_09170 [archaeon]
MGVGLGGGCGGVEDRDTTQPYFHPSPSPSSSDPAAHIRREIERLKSTGVYGGEEDPLLRELQALLPPPKIQHTI